MARYTVKVPVSGYALVEVEAGSKEEAIAEAENENITTLDIDEWWCEFDEAEVAKIEEEVS